MPPPRPLGAAPPGGGGGGVWGVASEVESEESRGARGADKQKIQRHVQRRAMMRGAEAKVQHQQPPGPKSHADVFRLGIIEGLVQQISGPVCLLARYRSVEN